MTTLIKTHTTRKELLIDKHPEISLRQLTNWLHKAGDTLAINLNNYNTNVTRQEDIHKIPKQSKVAIPCVHANQLTRWPTVPLTIAHPLFKMYKWLCRWPCTAGVLTTWEKCTAENGPLAWDYCVQNGMFQEVKGRE